MTTLITPTGLSAAQPAIPNPKHGTALSPDAARIQDALDLASPYDTIELKGTFQCKATDKLFLWQPVTLRGAGNSGATIANGGWLMCGHMTQTEIVSGMQVIIEKITFKAFTGGAIKITATGPGSANAIKQCTFTDYRYGWASGGGFKGAWPIIVGTGQLGAGSISGSLEISDCEFGGPDYSTLPGYPTTNDGMNNLIHVNNCHLDLLRIVKNTISDASFMGIAVWGVSGRTEIVRNEITVGNPDVPDAKPWTGLPGASTGIAFGLRPPNYPMDRDGSVVIEKNTINIGFEDSWGIIVGVFADSQYTNSGPWSGASREITIRKNVVNMLNPNNKRSALACLGACSGSTWADNVITGTAKYGILVRQVTYEAGETSALVQSIDPPSHNTFRDNKLAGSETIDPTTDEKHLDSKKQKAAPFEAFTASRAQVCVDVTSTAAGPHVPVDTTVDHNSIGPISGSNAADWPPPLATPHAGIVSYGDTATLSWNDFSTSGIAGWPLPPQQPPANDPRVGCIYLAPESRLNHVYYRQTDFPAGTVPPPEHQILDVANSSWAPKWQTTPLALANTMTETAGPKPVVPGPFEAPHVADEEPIPF